MLIKIGPAIGAMFDLVLLGVQWSLEQFGNQMPSALLQAQILVQGLKNRQLVDRAAAWYLGGPEFESRLWFHFFGSISQKNLRSISKHNPYWWLCHPINKIWTIKDVYECMFIPLCIAYISNIELDDMKEWVLAYRPGSYSLKEWDNWPYPVSYLIVIYNVISQS